MSATRITSESYQSDILRCERCDTVLPKYATFCGQCGLRVESSTANSELKDTTEFTDQYRITSLVRRGPYMRIARALDTLQQQSVIICDVDLSILDTQTRVQATQAIQDMYDLLHLQQMQYTVPLIGLRSSSHHLYMISAWPRNVQQKSTSIQKCSTLQETLQSGIGLPDERTALLWMQHMSQAVAELHRHQLLFVDLDPQTIVVPDANYREEAALLLSCLPLSVYKLFSSTLPGTNATAFCAPEVRHGEAEPRSDVYSLGAILYFLLTGTPPVVTNTRMHHRIRTPREINPRIHSAVSALVMQAIANETTKRIQSAEELAQALASVAADPHPVQNVHIPILHQNKLSTKHKSAPIQPTNIPVPAANIPREQVPALPKQESAPVESSTVPTQLLPALPKQESAPVKLNSIFTRQENTLIPTNSTPTAQKSALAKQPVPQEEIKISSPDDDNKSIGSKPTQQSPGLDDVTISIVPLQAQMARRYLSKIKTGQMGAQEQASGEAIVEEGSSKKQTTREGDIKKEQLDTTLVEANGRTQAAMPTSAQINPDSQSKEEASSAKTLLTQSSESADLPLAGPQVQELPISTVTTPAVVEAAGKQVPDAESNGTTQAKTRAGQNGKVQSAEQTRQESGQQQETLPKKSLAQGPQEQSEELDHASTETTETPTNKSGENREKALARLKDIFTGSMPAIPRINPPRLPSSHAPQKPPEVSPQPAAVEVSDERESSLLKRMQRFILGEQQHNTTAAALIETPLRIQPNQSYSIRINIMGRNALKREDATAGLSGMVEGDIAHIEVRSALYQNYAYIVQQADVQVPAEGYVAEVTMPMQPLSSGPSGRRERLHIFFMDAAHSPLYEKPFVIELFISHLVQTGREGHSVLSIPL